MAFISRNMSALRAAEIWKVNLTCDTRSNYISLLTFENMQVLHKVISVWKTVRVFFGMYLS